MAHILTAIGKHGPAFADTLQITPGYIVFDYRTVAIIGEFPTEDEARRLVEQIDHADYMSHGAWLTANDFDRYENGGYSFREIKKVEKIHDVWSGNPDTDKFWR